MIYFFVLGIILFFIIRAISPKSGKVLKSKFQSLKGNNIIGMSKSDIIKKCGHYTSVSYIQGGTCCAWVSKDCAYSIAILFDKNDEVNRITTETYVAR